MSMFSFPDMLPADWFRPHSTVNKEMRFQGQDQTLLSSRLSSRILRTSDARWGCSCGRKGVRFEGRVCLPVLGSVYQVRSLVVFVARSGSVGIGNQQCYRQRQGGVRVRVRLRGVGSLYLAMPHVRLCKLLPINDFVSQICWAILFYLYPHVSPIDNATYYHSIPYFQVQIGRSAA